MFIRSVRLADILLLPRLQRQTLQLDAPETLITDYSPPRVALISWLPLASSVRTFVLGNRRAQAFIQLAVRARGHIWEVLFLGSEASATPPDASAHPWHLLLNSAAIVAARRRVTRLLAATPEDEATLAIFRGAGFQTYAHETVYGKIFEAGDRLGEAPPEGRAQGASDAWLIHRLYFQTIPRTVQDAEARTSNYWELRRAWPGGPRERGWLLEEDAEIIAYTRTLSHGQAHRVEWLYQPAHRELLPQLVRQTLAHLPAAPGHHVFWRVPEYQHEVGALLEEAGFSPVSAHALMVRYLAVKVAARERLFAPIAPAKRRRALPTYRGPVVTNTRP
jgi:hypothetical protein